MAEANCSVSNKLNVKQERTRGKICMFAANYFPHIGGLENYVYHLSKELLSIGYSVTIVTSNLYGCSSHEFVDGIEIYRMPCYSLIGDRYPICKVNKEFRMMERKLQKYKFNLIIIHARFYFHSVFAAKFACRNHIKCITIEHGTSHLSVNNRLLDFLGGIWEHGITAILKKYCHHYYGVSATACEWSRHFGIKSDGMLYNAVDIEEIERLCENPVCSYKNQYNIPVDSLVITFTGRMIPEKGIGQLVTAFHELKLDNAYLFVAGKGEMLEELEMKGYDRVIYLGAIDFPNIVALLKESDIFCLPSVSEGMPTSVLEAIACKTFVITTRQGGAAEIITDRSYGIVMENNSVESLKEAIMLSLDKNYREECANNCFNRLSGMITWRKTAEKVIKILEDA